MTLPMLEPPLGYVSVLCSRPVVCVHISHPMIPLLFYVGETCNLSFVCTQYTLNFRWQAEPSNVLNILPRNFATLTFEREMIRVEDAGVVKIDSNVHSQSMFASVIQSLA